MAQFLNESCNGQFKLTIDEEKKSVSLTKLNSANTANTMDTVMTAMDALFESVPTTHKRQMTDQIVAD